MSTSLERRLRSAIGAVRDDQSRQALYAVTDEIEDLRRTASDYQTEAVVDRFEQAIARSLGVDS